MLITKIKFSLPLYRQNNPVNNTPNSNNNNGEHTTVQNFAYRDYNISFGERLFRTPKNFYAQDFNQKNMPKTMKDYLYEDYEDRQNMPPNQMMRLVFQDIEQMESLDDVRTKLGKNEPLFANLTSNPNRKARTGLLYQIETAKDLTLEYPLFKDGTSDFGMYLLKKIYLEGKTRKEIDADFKKDLEPIYEDLITENVDYETLQAYGIKFPKQSFWKSFVATREDFPYEYKPRLSRSTTSGEGKKERTLSEIMSRTNWDTRPPKFKPEKNFTKNRGRCMGETIIEGHCDGEKTSQLLEQRGIVDPEELSFVCRYLKQIMSVALERNHASEEMRNYFENYNSLNFKNRNRLESYWRSNPQMRELQSLAISDTIKLFYDYYGADGNNDMFRELLDYANNIKSNREDKLAKHAVRQAELEETFENYVVPEIGIEDSQAVEDTPSQTNEPLDLSKDYPDDVVEDLALEEAKKNGAEVFTFISPTGEKYSYVGNVDEMFEKKIKFEFKLMPDPLVRKFVKFALKSPKATYDYKKAIGLRLVAPDFVIEQTMPIKDCRQISIDINKDFALKYPKNMLAGEQALANLLMTNYGINDVNLLSMTASRLSIFAEEQLHITNYTAEEKNKIEKLYQEYLADVTNKNEIAQLTTEFIKALTSKDPGSSEWIKGGQIDDVSALVVAVLRKYPKCATILDRQLRQSRFIERYGGSARILNDNEISDDAKFVKAKLMLDKIIESETDCIVDLVTIDPILISKYAENQEVKATLLKRYHAKLIHERQRRK